MGKKKLKKQIGKAPINPKKILSDPIYFVERIIGMKLTNFQKEWFKLVQEHPRCVIMAFRSSGKTSQLFVHYFLWKAIRNPQSSYLIISKTLPQAIEILKSIRLTIITNPFLKSFAPRNRNQNWSRTELELVNHSRILSKPYNDNVRGMHVDGVGVDELGEMEDHEVLKKAILPTIRAKRGFFVGSGTPKSEMDLLHEIQRDPSFEAFYFDAYPAEGLKGNLFEERYPDVRVEHKDGAVHIIDRVTNRLVESYSNMAWAQEFLLNPISMKDKLFPEFMIQSCLNPSEAFQSNPVNMKTYFMGCDFAMSASAGSDFTVIIVLEKSLGDKKLKLVMMERWRGLDYEVQKQRIIEIANRYQVIKILGDEGSFGKVFIYDLKREGMPIEGYKFTPASKEELIKALRDQFEKQGFILPYHSECIKTKTNVNILMKELSNFGVIWDLRTKTVKFEGVGAHDDTVSSLALANFIARHMSMGLFSVVRSRQPKSTPFFAVSK